NRSEKRLHRSDLSGQVLDYLHELNENDLKLYGFAKAIFEERFAAMTDELVRDRYDRRRGAGVHRRSSIRVNFDDPIDGDGWYPPEVNSDGQVFRWTGPGLTASIDLPLPPRTE